MSITGKTATLVEDYMRKSGQSLPTKKANRRYLRQKQAEQRTAAERAFVLLCKAHGLPTPISEFHFWHGRQFRFDWLFDGWLAVEIEGGIYSGGAHTRGKHFESDIEKYNEAAILGYTLLRFTPEQIDSGEAFAVIRRALLAEGEQP